MTESESAEAAELGVTQADVKVIFSNVEIIHRFNSDLLKDLEARVLSDTKSVVGDIFLQMAGGLKLYTAYVNNFSVAQKTVKRLMAESPRFQSWLQDVQKKNIEDLHRNDIAALLIMPIQRIPRYVLLLSDLVKHTEPDHSDYKNLQQAVSHITSIAEFVNHKKQEADNLGRLLIIQQHIHGLTETLVQPDRRLIREGVLDARFLKNQEKAEGKSPVADGQPAAATPRKRTILGGGGGGHYRTPSNSSPTSPSTPQSPSHGQQSTEMRKRMFFLFNDSLLETKVRGRESERKSGDEEEYTFKGIYPINKVRVAEEDAGDDGCSFSLLIDEQSDRSTFTKMILTATSKSVALSWISDCKAAKDELREQWEFKLQAKDFYGTVPPPVGSCCACIHEKRIYLFGGYSEGKLSSSQVHILDTEKGMWAAPAVIGKAPTPRTGHTMTKVRSMTGVGLLVFGGFDGKDHLSDVNLFQCGSDSWMQPRISGIVSACKRSRHSATLVGDHQVYIFGGRTSEGATGGSGGINTRIAGRPNNKALRALNDLHVFDARRMIWSRPKTRGEIPPARYGHTATLVEGDKIYIIGGLGENGQPCTDVYIFNTAKIPGLVGHSALAVGAETIFLYGGRRADSSLHSLSLLNSGTFEVEEHDDEANVMPAPRFCTGALVDGSTLYVLFGNRIEQGGDEKASALVDIEDTAAGCKQLNDAYQLEIILKGKTKRALESQDSTFGQNADSDSLGFTGVVNLGTDFFLSSVRDFGMKFGDKGNKDEEQDKMKEEHKRKKKAEKMVKKLAKKANRISIKGKKPHKSDSGRGKSPSGFDPRGSGKLDLGELKSNVQHRATVSGARTVTSPRDVRDIFPGPARFASEEMLPVTTPPPPGSSDTTVKRPSITITPSDRPWNAAKVPSATTAPVGNGNGGVRPHPSVTDAAAQRKLPLPATPRSMDDLSATTDKKKDSPWNSLTRKMSFANIRELGGGSDRAPAMPSQSAIAIEKSKQLELKKKHRRSRSEGNSVFAMFARRMTKGASDEPDGEGKEDGHVETQQMNGGTQPAAEKPVTAVMPEKEEEYEDRIRQAYASSNKASSASTASATATIRVRRPIPSRAPPKPPPEAGKQ